MKKYACLPTHDVYSSLCNQDNYAAVRNILVQRVVGKLAQHVVKPTVFNCFAVKTQRYCKAALKKTPLLTCTFHRFTGEGRLATGDNTQLGILRPLGKDGYAFDVNNRRLLSLTIKRETKTECAQYSLLFDGTHYVMAQPFVQKQTDHYTLKYTLMKTTRFGKESVKNHCFEDASNARVLECIKYAKNHMFVAFKPPFNLFVAAVLAIIRYRLS
jgi:hypothetical protein